MVNYELLCRRVAIFQFIGVVLVCINHLPITLTKGFDAIYNATLYRDSAWLGLSIIFVCAGFLTDVWARRLRQRSRTEIDAAVAVFDAAFVRYAFPLFVGCLADVLFQSYNNVFGDPGRLAALPLFATLTQAWVYRVFDITTYYFPFSGINIGWLCSHLFFLTLLYAAGQRFFPRLPAWGWASVLVLCAVAHVAFHGALHDGDAGIRAFALARYGETVTNQPSTSLLSWLSLYMPYAHIAEFGCGLALARLCGLNWRGSRTTLAALGCALLFLLLASPAGEQAWMLGLALLGMIGLVWKPASAPAREQTGVWARIVAARLEIFVFHILLFAPYTPAGPVPADAHAFFFMTGKVIMASVFLGLVCVGAHEFGYLPLRNFIFKFFGIEATGNEAM